MDSPAVRATSCELNNDHDVFMMMIDGDDGHQSMPARDQGQRLETCCAKKRKTINIEFKSSVFA